MTEKIEMEQNIFDELTKKILYPHNYHINTTYSYEKYEEYYDKLLIEIDKAITEYPKLINMEGKKPYYSYSGNGAVWSYDIILYGNLLHVSCVNFHLYYEIVKLLLDKGFDPLMEDRGKKKIPIAHFGIKGPPTYEYGYSGQKVVDDTIEYYISKLPEDVIDFYTNGVWRIEYDFNSNHTFFLKVIIQKIVCRKLELQRQFYEHKLREQKEQLLEELYRPDGRGYQMARKRFRIEQDMDGLSE